jgi:glucan phosphoethanolaminetransferase (alkaline phosphatase superfamily)
MNIPNEAPKEVTSNGSGLALAIALIAFVYAFCYDLMAIFNLIQKVTDTNTVVAGTVLTLVTLAFGALGLHLSNTDRSPTGWEPYHAQFRD